VTGPREVGRTELGEVEFGPDDLRRVRDVVRNMARDRIPGRVENAVLAVHEVAVNSIVHGGGRAVLLIHETSDSLVFTIEDEDGTGSVPQMSEADELSTSGRGLWIAHQLSDGLTIEGRPTRTRVGVRLLLVS
jgi:anti-sigma regulatory factor (Ser/Thr protein kinase)